MKIWVQVPSLFFFFQIFNKKMIVLLMIFLWVASFSYQSILYLTFDLILYPFISSDSAPILVENLVKNFDKMDMIEQHYHLQEVYKQYTGIQYNNIDMLIMIRDRGDIDIAKEISQCHPRLAYFGDSWIPFLKSYVEAQINGDIWVPDYSVLKRRM